MTKEIEIELAADEKRWIRSKAYDIARKAFSNANVDIDDVLAKHTGEFREMIASDYEEMEAAAKDGGDSNWYDGHA